MTISGIVTEIFPTETGISKSGNEWKKSAFVLTIPGQYAREVYVTVFGKSLDSVKVELNKKYDVEVDISSRRWTASNGKTSWFTDVSAWRATPAADVPQTASIQPQAASTAQSVMPPEFATPNYAPQAAMPQNNVFAPSTASAQAVAPAEDDLPF